MSSPKFKQLWDYVQAYLIDQVNGDWYQGGIDKQPQCKMALKGQILKGTYHVYRAFMDCILSLTPDKIPPATPVNFKLQHLNKSLLLNWSETKWNKTFMGYNIYLSGKRTWYTPITSFTIPGSTKGKNLKIKAIDMHGNESGFSKTVVI